MDLLDKDSTDQGWPFDFRLYNTGPIHEAIIDAEEGGDGLNRIFQVGPKVIRGN